MSAGTVSMVLWVTTCISTFIHLNSYYTSVHHDPQISAGLALGHAEFKGQLRMRDRSIVHTRDLLCEAEFRHHQWASLDVLRDSCTGSWLQLFVIIDQRYRR